MGWIYEVRRFDELRCHDIHTKFHKDWFSHRQHGDSVSLLLFYQSKERGLKTEALFSVTLGRVQKNYLIEIPIFIPFCLL
jgi:hypothetical protein